MTNKLKKPIAFLAVFAMLLSVLLYFPEGTFGGFGLGVRASAVTLEVPYGSGSSGNPYLIDTAGKLYWFANYVNEHYSHRGASARLTDDIEVNPNVLDVSGNLNGGSFEQWTPIGSETYPYCGIFEGDGHTISGLYFDNPGAENAGLFGVVGTGYNTDCSISYVGIVDSYFNGGNNVGSICGKANSGATVKGCFSMGSVSGTSNVGGIVGSADITVENCYYLNGRVSGVASDASLAMDAEKFTSGEIAYKLNKYPYAPFWGQIITVDNIPKALTFDQDGLCTNKVYYANGAGYHNHDSEYVACDKCGTIAAEKPALNNDNYLENKDYYEITNKNELYWFALHVNCGAGIKSLAILKNDIILNENVLYDDRNPNPGPFYEWTPIGTPERIFAGVFEGGYRVSGLYINKPTDDYLGLFGYATAYERDSGIRTTSVRWVGIIDSYVCGNNYVGGLAGRNDTSLEQCFSTAKVVSANSSTFAESPLRGGGTGSMSDCAYISDTTQGYGRTAAQFASGDAAYIISEEGTWIWGQNLSGDNPDPLPVHLTEENRVYYTDGIYHNHNAAVSDYCSLCKVLVAKEPHQNSSTGEYEISNRAELLWFAEYVNAGNYTANAVLTADIVVNDEVFDANGNVLPDLLTIPVMGSYTVTSISTKDNPFLGSFRGDGHTISGLYYSETSTNRIGLIGYAGSSAQISGVRITNSYIEGYKAVGAVCGLNAGGTISECSTDGCVITGTDVGGICGTSENGGIIKNCFNASKVSGTGAGGICGFNNSSTRDKLTNCINIGVLYGGVVNVCGTGFGSKCYVLTKNPLAAPSDKSTASSIVGLTDDNFISTNRFGSEWTKAANDTANNTLYFPRLAAFSGSDISVTYTPKLVLENTNTSTIYYKDDLTFTFDAVLTINGEEYSAAGADTLLKLSDIDFKIVHNGDPDDFDRVTTSVDYFNMRLVLKIGGHDAGYIYVDPSTNKITVKITEDINAGSHSFDIKYNGTALPVFTGLSVSHTVDIQKGIPVVPALPSATEISYGEQLAESELKDANGNTDTVWQWVDETTVPKVSQTTQQIITKNAVDYVNYDYSGVDGYDASTHLITKDITLTIKRAVPTIVVTATPSSALPGETVTVSAAISNPNNSSLTDLPDADFYYVIGTGSEQAITDGSFVIPTDTENGTVITIIAKTSETADYDQVTDRRTTVTVNKEAVTIKADNKTVYQNAALPAFTYSVTGLASGETLAITPVLTCEAADTSTVGTYTITVTIANNEDDKHIYTVKNGTLTVQKKSTGSSSGGSSGGSGGSSSTTNPSIGGSEKSWNDIAADLAKLANGSEVTIELNGLTTVPVEVITVIDERDLKVTFVVDSVRSWKTDGAEITTPAAADLTFTKTTSTKSDSLRGTAGTQFRINDTGIPTSIKINFKTEYAGQFANLYKNVDGKLVFVTCAKLDKNGNVTLSDVKDKGDYIVMLCEFSDKPGDMNNDGVLDARDAAAILRYLIGLEKGANPEMADFNGDGEFDARDAAAILRKLIETA